MYIYIYIYTCIIHWFIYLFIHSFIYFWLFMCSISHMYINISLYLCMTFYNMEFHHIHPPASTPSKPWRDSPAVDSPMKLSNCLRPVRTRTALDSTSAVELDAHLRVSSSTPALQLHSASLPVRLKTWDIEHLLSHWVLGWFGCPPLHGNFDTELDGQPVDFELVGAPSWTHKWLVMLKI